MPQPGDAFQPQPSAEDSFLDLLAETLDGLDEPVRGQFLRQFFHTIAQIDLTESQSNEYWERILLRRRELAENLGKRVSSEDRDGGCAGLHEFPARSDHDGVRRIQETANQCCDRRADRSLQSPPLRRIFRQGIEPRETLRPEFAIVILDLHKLKEVNDRHGHLQGDQVLQLAATTLRKTLRASDFAFRIGGDEFALLLPQTDPEQAITLCRRVRAQYESGFRPLKMDIAVTLDFGVAVHPHDGDQKSALMGPGGRSALSVEAFRRTRRHA